MMFRKRFLCLILALVCLLSFGSIAYAAQVDCDATYCFTSADFSHEEEEISGICITQLPDATTGTVLLGNRVIRQGDILTAQQVAEMTFCPLRTEENQDAVVTYLPIYDDRVEKSATMTISIRGKQDKAPVAEDFALETYKNLPNQGKLKVTDPEGETLTYSVVRQPKRGEVVLTEDGSFTYTPKKNKVGVDSFTYTATDPAGNVSREATVTIEIMKPTAAQYTDTAGKPCQFAAEWMKNTGLFVGEKVGGKDCFQPEKQVSRGQFLAMLVDALDIPMEDVSFDALPQDTPDWLKPYLAAAMRSGMTANLPDNKTVSFEADSPILEGEVAVMVQNALDLPVLVNADSEEDTEVPAWAQTALAAMADNGIVLSALEPMTRGEAAQILYQISKIAPEAPGMSVIRMQQ